MQELTDFQKKYLERLKEEEQEEVTKNSILIKSFIDFTKQKGVQLNDAGLCHIESDYFISAR